MMIYVKLELILSKITMLSHVSLRKILKHGRERQRNLLASVRVKVGSHESGKMEGLIIPDVVGTLAPTRWATRVGGGTDSMAP
jgi:hypothetical protein